VVLFSAGYPIVEVERGEEQRGVRVNVSNASSGGPGSVFLTLLIVRES